MPPQLREIGCHVQNHATQWHGFQHEIQFQEVVVAWIQLTLLEMATEAAACNYETGTKWGKTVLFFLPHYLLLRHKLSIKILYLPSYFEIIYIFLF